MKINKRSYLLFLEDNQLAMSRIEGYIFNYDFAKFIDDNKTVDAVIRNFEIIGEASKNLNEELKAKYPNVPWREMYYLRNRVSHEYFGVDNEIIWDIAKNYLPKNKIQIDLIIEKETTQNP